MPLGMADGTALISGLWSPSTNGAANKRMAGWNVYTRVIVLPGMADGTNRGWGEGAEE